MLESFRDIVSDRFFNPNFQVVFIPSLWRIDNKENFIITF